MLTYCSGCKKHTGNICPKKLFIMTSKKIKGKSRCADCIANKSFFDKIGDKRGLKITASQFLIDRIL